MTADYVTNFGFRSLADAGSLHFLVYGAGLRQLIDRKTGEEEMATTFVTAPFIGAGTQFNLLADMDLYVARGVAVISAGAYAITGDDSSHTVVIAGEVAGLGGILSVNGLLTTKNVTILAGGSVTATQYQGVDIRGLGSTFTNSGDIFALFGAVTV